MSSYWRIKAGEAIAAAIAQAIAKGVNLADLTESQKTHLRSAIDAACPFQSLAPYTRQIWLDERRKAFTKLGLNAISQPTVQASLFDNYGQRQCE